MSKNVKRGEAVSRAFHLFADLLESNHANANLMLEKAGEPPSRPLNQILKSYTGELRKAAQWFILDGYSDAIAAGTDKLAHNIMLGETLRGELGHPDIILAPLDEQSAREQRRQERSEEPRKLEPAQSVVERVYASVFAQDGQIHDPIAFGRGFEGRAYGIYHVTEQRSGKDLFAVLVVCAQDLHPTNLSEIFDTREEAVAYVDQDFKLTAREVAPSTGTIH